MTKLGVAGGGTMGSGIVQVAAQQGMEVVLWDVRQDLVDAAVERIRGFIQRGVERGRMAQAEADAVMARISTTIDFEDFGDVDAVIEAVLEDIKVKADVFRRLDEHCPARTILASNTSSLSVTEIAAATRRPEAVVGMHFFNPVPLMALVEIVRGNSTSPETMERGVALARELGKTPARVEDTPGFLVNRTVRPFYNEALRIVNDGVVAYPEIDRIMKGAGFRMGPFELMDLIGNDVNLAVTASIFDQLYGEPRFRPSYRQQRMVQSGNLGQKTKRGWYDYAGGQPAASVPSAALARAAGGDSGSAASPLPSIVAVVADSALGVELAQALSAEVREVRLYAAGGDQVVPELPLPLGEGGGEGGPYGRSMLRPYLVADLVEAVAGAGLAIDATTGPVEAKRGIVRQIDATLAPGIPLASLALMVGTTEIASWCGDPARVGGFGYLPPLAEANVVEVAPGLQTGDVARAAVAGLVAALGKEMAVVGDSAGLVSARIVALIINEAAYGLAEGIATAEDIDTAVRLGANYPHGPLEWADLMGVDVAYGIIKGLYEEFGDDRYRPAPLLRNMVLAGRTGRAAGRGFFTY